MYRLPTSDELRKAGFPYGKTPSENIPCGRESTEWLRTDPDAVVYLPSGTASGGNEMVHVTEVPGRDCLFAVWHQDSVEGARDGRILYSRSRDGQIWEEARMLAGVTPGREETEYMALAPYPIATPSGRIYVFYVQHTEASRRMLVPHIGLQMCRYTDDCGETWSEPVPVPRNVSPWDAPGRGDLKCMLVIQNPIRLADGRYLGAFSEFSDEAVFPYQVLGGNLCSYAVSYFAVFENLAEDPEPEDIRLTWLPDDPGGLHLMPEDPPYSSAQEPYVLQLPNGWLFVTLRNFAGCIRYSVSEDLGHTWRQPKPMRYADGTPFVNPDATPFLCDHGDGTYIQLYYGRAGGYEDMFAFRDRVLRAVGRFAPEEEQPIRFDKKGERYMAIDVAAGPRDNAEINLEASFTRFHGVPMLWYGDRKHYVLGKRL